jgi:hypothetical protein
LRRSHGVEPRAEIPSVARDISLSANFDFAVAPPLACPEQASPAALSKSKGLSPPLRDLGFLTLPRRETPAARSRAAQSKVSPKKMMPSPPKNRMRLRASHPEPHRDVISCAALSPLGGGMTAPARQRPRSEERRVPHLPKPTTDPQSCDHKPAAAAVASGPVPLQGEQNKRRPQRPGNPHALARVSGVSSGDSPSRAAGCRWLCRNHSAGCRNFTFSLHTLSACFFRLAMKNPAALVQKLWTTGLPCGSARKI